MNFKKLFIMAILFIVMKPTYADAIFSIFPSITSTTIRSDSYTVIPYTVTNISHKILTNITITPKYNTKGQVFLLGNNCVSLLPGGSCSFSLMIRGNHQPNKFIVSPKVCAFKNTACSQPIASQRLLVNTSRINHLSRAYVGLANNTVYPIALSPTGQGILGAGLTGFNFNEPSGIAFNTDGTIVYVTNNGTQTIYMINTSLNKVIKTLNVGMVPVAIISSPDGSKLYVANFNDGQSNGTVSVLNAYNGALIATIHIGNGPWGLAIRADGKLLYATNSYDNTVSVIDALTYRVLATVPVGLSPLGIVVTPDGTKVFVVNVQSNTVSVINTNNNQVIATINVGLLPKGIAVSPDSSTVYVTNWQSGTIQFINTATYQITSTANLLSGLLGISVSPDGTQLYVTSDQVSAVATVNTQTHTVHYIAVPSPQVTMGNFIG